MPNVLIVEDEAVLRSSLVRGIAKMEGVEVDEAPSVNDALAVIDRRPVDLIVSDIDMPDRTGIELLGELGRRGLQTPIIYVSAYLKAYGAQIPRHANIEVLEKPVALDDLRSAIHERIAARTDDDTPFSVPDFLQLASMGRRSVIVEASWPDGTNGWIQIVNGEVWAAEAGEAEGLDAFTVVAWKEGSRVRCRTCHGDPGPRQLEGSAEGLLMDTARELDEHNRDHGQETSFFDVAVRHSSIPPESARLTLLAYEEDLEWDRPDILGEDELTTAPEGHVDELPSSEQLVDDAFSRQLDRGIRALLGKDMEAAVAAFEAAEAIRPGHPTVTANLARLSELGFGGAVTRGVEYP